MDLEDFARYLVNGPPPSVDPCHEEDCETYVRGLMK